MKPPASSYETLPRDELAASAATDWAFRSALHLLRQPVDAAISSLLEEIGQTMDIGAARVCQIKKAALDKLREKLRDWDD